MILFTPTQKAQIFFTKKILCFFSSFEFTLEALFIGILLFCC